MRLLLSIVSMFLWALLCAVIYAMLPRKIRRFWSSLVYRVVKLIKGMAVEAAEDYKNPDERPIKEQIRSTFKKVD